MKPFKIDIVSNGQQLRVQDVEAQTGVGKKVADEIFGGLQKIAGRSGGTVSVKRTPGDYRR